MLQSTRSILNIHKTMTKRFVLLSVTSTLISVVILSALLLITPWHASHAQCGGKTVSNTNTSTATTNTTKAATAEEIAENLFPETNATSITDQYLAPTGGIYMAADNELILNKASRTDVAVAGNTVTVNKDIGGDLFIGGNTVNVNGDVAGSVRIGARTVSINGTVTGNTLIFANQVTISENAALKGHANIYASTINIEGSINKATHLGASTIYINGELKDQGELEGNSIAFGPEAIITKEITALSPFTIDVNPSTEGISKITYQKTEQETTTTSPKLEKYRKKFSHWMISFFSFAIIGVLMILFWPKWTKEVADTMMKKHTEVWTRGLLFFFVVPTIAFLIAFTIIGIPITFIAMFAYILLLLLGRLFAGIAFGHWLVHQDRCKDQQKQYILYFLVGYFVLSILFSLSWIGWIICSIACIWGVGGLLQVAKQNRKKKSKKRK